MPFLTNNIFKNILPKTLLMRFMLIITLPTLIGQLLLIFLFYDRHWYNVSYYSSKVITQEINELLTVYDSKSTPRPNDKEFYEYLNLSYKFHDNKKIKRKPQKLTEELEIFKNILNNQISYPKFLQLDKEGKIELLIQLPQGVLQVIIPTKTLLNPTTYIFVLWLIALTIILLGVSLIFSRNQIKSILELAAAADAFGRGQKLKNYKPYGAREIRLAGLAIIKMKDRIERQITKRATMLAMISHDLRTPLTRMTLQLELADEFVGKEELKDDIKSMQTMIDSYLAFVQGEGGEAFKAVKLDAWLENYLKRYWPNLDITLNVNTNKCNVQIKENSFSRAIANILTNSQKYATKILISIYNQADNNIYIDFEDNGPGIPSDKKNLALKPFIRLDASRSLNSSSSNVGLGLAITNEIIIGHYGTISLEDSKKLGGLLLRVTLPII